VADGSVALPLRELLEQVGVRPSTVGARVWRAEALEFAQTVARAVRGAVGRGLQGVDAAVARASSAICRSIDAQAPRVGGERHDVARTDRLGGARVERHVVRAARGRLNDSVEGSLELVGESFARHAPGENLRPRQACASPRPVPGERCGIGPGHRRWRRESA